MVRGCAQDFDPYLLPTRGGGCLLGGHREAGISSTLRGSQPYISCHLAWEPTPPACSLGKARPHPGETKPRQTLPILQ